MLIHLSIQNYALIRRLEIDFDAGFSVITGETGAGKSIILGALNLILGKRADTQVLFDKSKKCIVEGTFDIEKYNLVDFFRLSDIDYDNDSILRREISAGGKSRAFINDTPVGLNVLKELSEYLIDIHSQFETSELSQSDFQLSVVDSFGGLIPEVKNYDQLFRNYSKLGENLELLSTREKQAKSEQDYFQFILTELNQADLRENEQEELEAELAVLNHAEEIKSKLYEACLYLQNTENSIIERLGVINHSLQQVSEYSASLKEISVRTGNCYIDLSELFKDIEKTEQQVIIDPRRVDLISQRLDLIYKLQNKHRVNSISSLLLLQNELTEKLQNIHSLENEIDLLKKEVSKLEEEVNASAHKLTIKRKQVFHGFQQKIISDLKLLGMPNARLEIRNLQSPVAGKNGFDSVRFYFNANGAGELQELSKIASGGEKSRLMLVIKSLVSMKNLLPTIIFDEIDLGVSGAVADKVGSILQSLSVEMQVIVITHLPQIAGKGYRHYLVFKESASDSATTNIRELTAEERVMEIAKLISGKEVTPVSLESAKVLLQK